MDLLGQRRVTFKMLQVGALCLPAVLVLGGAARTQTASGAPALPPLQKRVPYHLGMLIEQANWNVAQRGPLIALDPVLVYRNARVELPAPGSAGYDLRLAAPGFDRMLVSAGTLSVLAPAQMTLIEDTPRERPNLYDGLPRPLKVKYLMSTLTPQQWKTLGERGLGVGDLTGEQQPVYLSLLPNPFVVTRIPLNVKEGGDDRHTYSTLTPEQRAQVRLRVNRSAQFSVPLQNNSRVRMAVALPNERLYESNNAKWERNTKADEEKTDLFGVRLSSVVPNKLKPSQLDYASARLNAFISLEGAATLDDLMARVRAATGMEIYADGRVARLPLKVRGNRARAGDVLKALALAVTGTYRRVDAAFVLTSDLTGIGTRQMRLAEWQWQIKEQTEKLEKELTRQIVQHSGTNGGVLALGYAPNDPYALTPAIEQQALKGDVPAALLTPAVQGALRDAAIENEKQDPTGPQWRDDAARIDIHWRFAFQLPDGAVLPPDGYAGSNSEYHPRSEAKQATSGEGAALDLRPFAPRPLPAAFPSRTLFLTPRSPQDAVIMAQTAQRLGFTELVLYTEDKTILKAAINAAGAARTRASGAAQALRICAAVAPFAVSQEVERDAEKDAGKNAADPDRNLLGETAAQVGAARSTQPRWNAFLQQKVDSAGPQLVPERIGGVTSALNPAGSQAAARVGKIADLARTEGLGGLFLYDTQPDGYAGQPPVYNYPDDQVLFERGNLGYTSALRLAFLRQYGADPLDLTPNGVYVDVDLLLPFFPDGVAASHSDAARRQPMPEFTSQKGAKWDKFRAGVNRQMMTRLFAVLRDAAPALPLVVEARAERGNTADAARLWPAWASWTQPEKLLVGTSLLHSDKRLPLAPGERYLFPVQFSASDLLPAQAVLRQQMELLSSVHAKTGGDAPVALDFRFVPAPRALALLNEYIKPAPQTEAAAGAQK